MKTIVFAILMSFTFSPLFSQEQKFIVFSEAGWSIPTPIDFINSHGMGADWTTGQMIGIGVAYHC